MTPGAPATPLQVYVDVTDVVHARWRAGIQRVVCQLVHHLERDPRVDVRPIMWLESARSFRHLTSTERRAIRVDSTGAPAADPLAAEPEQTGPTGTARLLRLRAAGVAQRARAALVGLLRRLRLEPGLRGLRRWWRRRTSDRDLLPLVTSLPAGSVLLELDTVWNNTAVDRAELYATLRRRGVHVAALVYDLLPQTDPDWFEPSMVDVSSRTLAAQARADLVLAISEHTASTLRSWSRSQGIDPPDPVVIELGSDPTATAPRQRSAGGDLPEGVGTNDMLLMVGTIEPRKNHSLALDVFEILSQTHPELRLVIVGRPGWRNDDVVERIAGHPELGRRLWWLTGCDDAMLDELYDAATVVLVPSITEGYGLPVVEALAHGVPVVASTGGSLPEVGGELVDHVDPLDVQGWVRSLDAHLSDEAFREHRRSQVRGFEPPRWADTADRVASELLVRWGTSQ